MNQKSVSAKLLQNTLFNGGGKLANYVAVLVLTPFILSQLGAERFGLWALITLFAGQFGLLDIGFGAALTKYVAQYKATNQLELANSPFTAALCGYGLISGTLLVVLWYFRFPVFRFFSVPEGFWSESRYLIPGMVLIFFLTSILGVLQSIINGLQEMAITNAAAVLQAFCLVALTLGLLRAGFGVSGVVLATILSLSIAAVFLLAFLIRLMPELRLALFVRDPTFLPVLRFGAMVQLARVSAAAVAYADRILISHFLGLVLLAQYQLGYTVISGMRGVVLLLVSAVVPATSELAAKNDRGTLQNLYRRGTKYTLLAALAIGSAIITLAPQIARAWLGHDHSVVVMIIRFLATGHLVHVLTGLGTSMCEGMGMVGLEVKFGFGLTVLQVSLGIMTVQYLGLLGLLCSTTTVMAATSVWFLYKFDKSMRLENHVSWQSLLRTPLAVSTVASSLVLLLSRLLLTDHPAIIAPGVALILLVGSFLGSYILLILRSGYLDAFDRSMASHLPGGAFWIALLSRGQQ